MTGHHLILGERVDYLTGKPIADTHDERYRQAIAKLLVDKKGYHKTDIFPRRKLTVRAGGKCAQVPIDFSVVLNDITVMIIRYGPGSLVTRHRPAIAVSRLVTEYQVPLVIVTNGLDADIIDGKTGSVISKGIDSIPNRQTLLEQYHAGAREPVSPEKAALEQRIIYAYDVDDSCPCDDTICKL